MTDAQFGVLMSVLASGLAGIVAVVRWSVGRLVASLDANTRAHLESVKAMAEMGTKLDFVYSASRDVRDFVQEERSGVHAVPAEITPPMGSRSSRGVRPPQTPSHGVDVVRRRARTNVDDE